MILYVTQQGAYLKRANQRLLIVKEKETLQDIPVFKIDQVVLFGNITITPGARNLLLEQGIDVSLMSTRGRIKGHLMSGDSKNIYLRLAQYRRWSDLSSRLRIGRGLLMSKLQTQLDMLSVYRSRQPELENDFEPLMKSIDGCRRKAEEADTVESLRGCEGLASSVYFKGFSRAIRGDYVFTGRRMHPSTDPVNALLSLTYVCLTNEVGSYIEAKGFETMIGFVHGIKYGRKSLAMDMVEEFRHPVGDRFVLNLINYRIIQPDDFEIREKGAYYLREESAGKYFAEWEKCRKDAVGDGNPLDTLIRKQMKLLEHSVMKDRPYRGIWEVESDG